MLTCKTVSPQKAVSYFLQGYYLEGTSRWLGKGAEQLGLHGPVNNEEVFRNIAEGFSPDRSQQLSGKNIPLDKRRAALDCTFSAPKSVSLQALVAGDERLLAAHRLAVEKTLTLIEERYAHTRVRDGADRNVINTKNLVIAQFDHIETRELDPHLHTHCLIMNMTQLPDEQWYSHLNEAIYKNKKFLGKVYQSYLAAEVQKQGYEIEWHAHGQFDLTGYTKEQLEDFSKRRQQILAEAGPNSSWAERERAWEVTRKRKEKVRPEELFAKWREEAAALGIKFVRPKQLRRGENLDNNEEPSIKDLSRRIEGAELNGSSLLFRSDARPDPETQAVNLSKPELNGELKLQHTQPLIDLKRLDEAIAHCSERAVAFSQEDLEEFILDEGLAIDVTQLEPLIREHPELIRIPEQNGVRFTTQTALQRELATISLMQQGQGAVASINSSQAVAEDLEKTTLNEGQRQAVLMAVTTTDQFIAWQGVAGAGKTYALKHLQLQSANYNIKGFAPSAEAAKVLGEELGIEANTVALNLISEQPEEIQPKQLWIVDEAGLLSAKDAYALLQRAKLEQARVILVGDTKQLSAVEAGNPFKSLQQAGMTTVYLQESQRQRDPELKLAVDLIAEGRIEAGFTQLETHKCIKDVTKETKVEEIVQEYMQAEPALRAATLVLAGTNAERLEITQALRDALKIEGNLGTEAAGTKLKAKDLTTVQMGYTSHFAIGDMVMPLRNYKRRGLAKGELYEVIGKSTDHLQLKGSDGTIVETDTGFKKAVYERHDIEIAVGDRLRWTKNDRKLGRRNGQEFTVAAIEGNNVQIQYLDGSHGETVDLTKSQHLDYALVSTIYSSQGKTADRVLIAADHTIGLESFYVSVSRAKYELKLYTEDRNKLLELALCTKAKENPLELLRQQVKKQVPVESLVVAGKTVERPSANVEKPQLKRETLSSTLDAEARSAVAAPIKSADKKRQRVVSNQLPTQPPVKHSTEEPTSMAANMKAAARKLPDTPEWLAVGKRLYSQKHGWGKVEAILGSRLVVRLDSGEHAHILEWPDAIKSKRIVPEKEAFWTPGRAGESPVHIEQSHWKELVEGSAINPELASCNVQTVTGNGVYERLLSTRLEKIGGSGQYVTQPAAKLMKAYEQVAEGGWWAKAGCNACSLPNLKPGEQPDYKLWGSFKADNPRIDAEKSQRKGKREVIKYEHPLGEERQLFLFDVPNEIAERIYNKHTIQPTDLEKQSGFWHVVHKYNLPITITEGAKKTLSSLSQGEITIGLSGVNGGYSSRDQDKNRKEQRMLHPELKVFATPGREFRFAFDQDTKLTTVFNVRRDMVRIGELLELEGCRARVVQWQGDKGLDDLIVNQGPLAYTQAQKIAIPLARDAKTHYRGEYTRLSRQVRNDLPELTEEAVDVEVYKLAQAKGDIRDGARVIAQSDQVRSFQAELLPQSASDRTQAYIQHIEQQISQAHERNDDINPRQFRGVDNADSRESSSSRRSPNLSETRGLGHQHYRFAIEPGQLSAAITGRFERRKAERIAGSIEELTRCLEQFQLSIRVTETQRRAVEQLHTKIKQLLQQQRIGELLSAIRNRAEQKAIASAPIAQAIERLTQELNRQQTDDTTKSLEQLTAAISDYCQQNPAKALREESLNAVTDGGEWVRVKTDRPQLEQYNNQVGVVVGRLRVAGGEQVMVQIGKYTPGFDNSELEPLTKELKQEVQNDGNKRLQSSLPSSSPITKEPHIHNSNITQPQEILDDRPNPQQRQPVDGSSIGERIAQSLEADSRTTRPHRGHNDRPATHNAGPTELRLGTSKGRNSQPTIEQQPELIRRLDSLGGPTGEQGDRAQSTANNFNDPSASLDRGSSTAEQANSQSGTEVERPAADDRHLDRRISDLIERNHELKRRNSELKEPITRTNRAMARTTDSAVLKLEQQHRTADHHLGQYVDTLAGRNTVRPRGTESAYGQARPGVRANVGSYEQASNRIGSARTSLAALADSVRELSLEDVAARLGLEPDLHDKHKWRGEGQIVSITGQKFYDHLALKGGYGAIDLVMHVQGQKFKEAVSWLSNGANSLPPPTQRSQQYKAPPELKPFQPPAFDDSKWAVVRQYLTEKRQLPATLVDKLHSQGIIYADAKQNAVFVRQDMEGKQTGASLRGTYKDSQFKGLATGSRRDGGWFAFTQGEGQLERIVLIESPIDAISAAALAKQKTGTTLFLSTDGAGSIPTDFLRRQLASGKQILVAYDADAAGEGLAQKVMQALPTATRVKPSYGKDWNERLIMQQEAQATALCVKQMFNHLLRDVRLRRPDGSWTFEATKWRFDLQENTVTITDKQDNRELLRVEGDKPLNFSPAPGEREKLKDFREQVSSSLEQQQQLQIQQHYQQQQTPRPRL